MSLIEKKLLNDQLKKTQLTVGNFEEVGISQEKLANILSKPLLLNQCLEKYHLGYFVDTEVTPMVPEKFKSVWYRDEGDDIYIQEHQKNNVLGKISWPNSRVFLYQSPAQKRGLAISIWTLREAAMKPIGGRQNHHLGSPALDYIMGFNELHIDKIPDEWYRTAKDAIEARGMKGIKIFFGGTAYKSPRTHNDTYLRCLRITEDRSGFMEVIETHEWYGEMMGQNVYFAMYQ